MKPNFITYHLTELVLGMRWQVQEPERMTLNLWQSSLLSKTGHELATKVRRGGMTGGPHSWEGAYLKMPRWFQCSNNEASVIRCTNQRSIIISGLRGWQVQLEWFPTRYGGHNIFLIFLFSKNQENEGETFAYIGKMSRKQGEILPCSSFPTHTNWELSKGSTAFASRRFGEGRLIYLMYTKGLRTDLPKMYGLDMWIISN